MAGAALVLRLSIPLGTESRRGLPGRTAGSMPETRDSAEVHDAPRHTRNGTQPRTMRSRRKNENIGRTSLRPPSADGCDQEAAECIREGERNGTNEHDATGVSFTPQSAAEGTKTSYGGHGSDEVSGQPGAASPRGRPHFLDSRQGG